MKKHDVGLIGATSLVGDVLIRGLVKEGLRVTAFTRSDISTSKSGPVKWCSFEDQSLNSVQEIPFWISAAPIWVLKDYFQFLEEKGIRRIVVLSSTSRYIKIRSKNIKERKIAMKIARAEEEIGCWARENNIKWVILRPTLIYGFGRDKNISKIILFIKLFGFFPLLGGGQGLRQPIHANDVGKVCVSALTNEKIKNRAFNISGGETLCYKDMVHHIFDILGKKPRFINIPNWLFTFVFYFASPFLKPLSLSISSFERMNDDLVFDNSDARSVLNFEPGRFEPDQEDMK